MFGRHMNETLGKIHFWLTAGSVFPAFILMHLLGMGGALRRVYDPTIYEYIQPLQPMNVWITILLFVAIAGQLVFFVNFCHSMFAGRRAVENPWEGATLEWTTLSPAPHLNWDEPPDVYRGPYEYRVDGAEDGYLAQHVGPDETKPSPEELPSPPGEPALTGGRE
jgi:cytochrome c oxidase subunit 1